MAKMKRNAGEMRKFAKEAKKYEEEVTQLLTKMKEDLRVAYYTVGSDDKELTESINSLNGMADMIKANLPLITEASDKLAKSANIIDRAKSVLKK